MIVLYLLGVGLCDPIVNGAGVKTTVSGVDWSNTFWSWDGAGINSWADVPGDRPDITVERCDFTSVRCGGAKDQGFGGAISVKNGSLALLTCTFTTCEASVTGGAVYILDGSFSATDCNFSECSASEEGGALAAVHIGQRDLAFKNCEVRDCTTTAASVLYFQDIGMADFEGNTVENCTSNGGRILSMTCNDFTWVGNTFTLSIESGSASVIHIVRKATGELLIDNSHFSNDGKSVSRFFDLNQQGSWKFHDCSFTGIKTPDEKEGTAILISQENGVTDLEVIDCNFTDLSCQYNGGAVHVRHANFLFARCSFERCESREGWITSEKVKLGGSGGIYIEWNARGSVEDCTFTNNSAAINGQSLQIMIPSNANQVQVSVSNCTFKDHKSPSVLCFAKYETDVCSSLVSASFPYTIFNCTFENNVYESSDFGLVMASSTAGLSYEFCIFRGNQGKLLSVSDAPSDSPSFDLNNCSFENCGGSGLVFGRDGTSVGTVSFDTCDFKSCEALILELGSLGTSLSLSGCSFEDCHTTQHDSTVCVIDREDLTVSLSKCVFKLCGGSDGSILSVTCRELTLTHNEFNELRDGSQYGVHIGLSDKTQELLFDHCIFSNNGDAVTDTGKFIDITNEHENVSFIDCEFLEIGSASGGGALKLSLTPEDAVLSIARCKFYACYCENDGGAIHAQDTRKIVIDDCTFQECYCRRGYKTSGGGGAVYIKFETKSATISHCRFINNSSPQNGQSIELQCVPGHDDFFEKMVIFNCSFLNHASGSIVCFVYSDENNVILDNCAQDYILSSCTFQENEMKSSLLSDFGVFKGTTTRDIRYEDCEFISNTGADDSAKCLIGLHQKCASCTIARCNFTECHHDGGENGMICLRQTAEGLGTVTIDDCKFEDCSCDSGMISVLGTASLPKLDISNSQFSKCQSKKDYSSSVLFTNTQSSVSEISFSHNVVSECDGRSGKKIASIITISPTQLLFSHNQFDVAEHYEEFCIYVDMREFTGAVVVDECVFNNRGKYFFGQDAQFIHFAQSHGLQFISCVFENIASGSRGAIYFKRGTSSYDLEVSNCTFDKCLLDANGGAAIWAGSVRKLNVENCTFRSCKPEAYCSESVVNGGAIYIDYTAEQGSIVNCTFIDNKVCGSGTSVAVFTRSDTSNNDPGRIEFSECIFKDHGRSQGAILFFSYGNGQSSEVYPGEYKLASCTFENNAYSESGLVTIATKQIVYENCTFRNTGNENIEGGLLRIAAGTEACTLESCVFNYDSSTDAHMKSLLVLAGQVQTLSLISSTFSGLFLSSGLVAIDSSSARTLASLCDTFSITGCDFVQCKTSGSNPLLDISVANGVSKVQNTLFTVSSGSNSLFGLSCDSNAQIEFYNCCFTHSEDLSSAYITMNNIQGKVIFLDVCFDAEEEQAINYVNGKENVEFSGGNREGFFVVCQCWEPVKTAGPPTEDVSSSFGPVEPSDVPEESATTPLAPTESSGTDEPGPDSGSGKKANAGLIAGVVIGVIVIIVIVVVVILLLLRRRGSEEEDEGVAEDQEFTEETVTVTQNVATAGDWSQTTEDNPVFLNDGADETESPFGNMFEEDGFFTQ